MRTANTLNSDFFKPVRHVPNLKLGSMVTGVEIYTVQNGFPDLDDVKIAIFGVQEDRNSLNNKGCLGVENIRKKFYQLFLGDWQLKIADLGNIQAGETIQDTYFAVSQVICSLVKQNIIPIVIGGSQDITFANYKAYGLLEQMVNLVSVDSRFDLGMEQDELNAQSYLSKIIMNEPNNLFNFSNIGYQTYYNSQEEINLLDKMYFDACRLGESKNLDLVEPFLRDADIVSVDIGSIRQSDAPANKNVSANGFNGEEICKISRYAGISDKVTSFGIYEYNEALDENDKTAGLIAQMIWYFIEGVNKRTKDYPFIDKKKYQKFTVVLDDDDPINFYKSNKSGRWWMEINLITNNKYKRHTLISCTYQDYVQAINQKIPERWYKAMQKMS